MGRPEDIRLSFNEAAEVYDEARPSYPAPLFDELFRLLPAEPEIVEVGPGTGKATRDLLARGASVHAIEIGPAMAAKLRSNLPSDRLRISLGDFQVVPIEPGADAVFSATAYHWISPGAQTERPAAILPAGGILAIVDLIQVDSPDDLGFFAAAQAIYERYGEGHEGPPAPRRAMVDPPLRAALQADRRYDSIAVRSYDMEPEVQRHRVPKSHALVLGHADDGGIRTARFAQRHGGVHPKGVRRLRDQTTRGHAYYRKPYRAFTDVVLALDRSLGRTWVSPTADL